MTITLNGKILFEPINRTKKQSEQSSWKRVAMVLLEGDITEYYSWFIDKRFNLKLNKPLRGAHITFINDSLKDLTKNGTKSIHEVDKIWNEVKDKWNGKIIPIVLDLDVKTNAEHWWLNIPHENRELLQGIREELGLGRPFFGMHMSIGHAREGLNEEHSKYIHRLIKNGLIVN